MLSLNWVAVYYCPEVFIELFGNYGDYSELNPSFPSYIEVLIYALDS